MQILPVCCDSSVFSTGRDAWLYGGQDAHLHEGSQCEFGRTGSPLHAVVGSEKPDHLLRIVVCLDSWDGAHGVTRPTFAICKYFPVCCDSSVFSAGRDARFYGGQDARRYQGPALHVLRAGERHRVQTLSGRLVA